MKIQRRARVLVRRLRAAIAEDNARWTGEPRLSVQFGLACSGPGRRRSLRERADVALYARKRRVKRAAARAVSLHRR